MTILEEEKHYFFDELKELDLYRIKPILSNNQYALDDMLDYFPYKAIDRIAKLIRYSLTLDKDLHPKLAQKDLMDAFRSLIKEGVLYLIKNDESFLQRCQNMTDGKYIINYILMDEKTTEDDILFIFKNSLFSPGNIVDFFNQENMFLAQNKISKVDSDSQSIIQFLKVHHILQKEEKYNSESYPTLKSKICYDLAENYFYGSFSWEQILKSSINQYLKMEEGDYENFLIENKDFFNSNFTYLKLSEFKRILDCKPDLIGNKKEWLIEKLLRDYKSTNNSYSEGAPVLIKPECLELMIDRTPVSLEEKTKLLKKLFEFFDNSEFLNNHISYLEKDLNDYLNGFKQIIVNIEKEIITQNVDLISEDNAMTKRRI